MMNARKNVEASIRILLSYNELGKTDQERINQILPELDEHGAVPVTRVCEVCFPHELKPEARFRSFKARVSQAINAASESAYKNNQMEHQKMLASLSLENKKATQKSPRLMIFHASTEKLPPNLGPFEKPHYLPEDYVASKGAPDSREILLFISYSRQDKALKEQFIQALHTYQRIDGRYQFKVWSDSEIITSEEFDGVLNEKLSQADVCLLLVSEDILKSDYVLNKEIPVFLQSDKNRLMPISFKGDCDDLRANLKKHIQVYNHPALKKIAAQQWCELDDRVTPDAFSQCTTPKAQQDFIENLCRQIIALDEQYDLKKHDAAIKLPDQEKYPTREVFYPSDEYVISRGHTKEMATATSKLKLKEDTSSSEKSREVNILDDMQDWVLNGNTRLYALLGDFGMGKTFTCRQFVENINRDKSLCKKVFYIDLRDTPSFVDRNGQFTVPDLSAIIQSVLDLYPNNDLQPTDILNAVGSGDLIMIFDGLDERLTQFNKPMQADYMNRLMQIFQANGSGKPNQSRVIVSCRSHFFETELTQSTFFLQQQRGSVSQHDYRCVHVMPFSDQQIKTLLQKKLKAQWQDAWQLLEDVPEIKDLASRPFLLQQLVQLLPRYRQQWTVQQRIGLSTLYEAIIEDSLERDSDKLIVSKRHKLRFLMDLAHHLWVSKLSALHTNDLNDWYQDWLDRTNIRHLYQQDIHVLEKDLRNSSLLVREQRDGKDIFHLGHTSIGEYLLAQWLLQALQKDQLDWPANQLSEACQRFIVDSALDLTHQQRQAIYASLCKILATDYSPQSLLALALVRQFGQAGLETPQFETVNLSAGQLQHQIVSHLKTSQLMLQNCNAAESRWCDIVVDKLILSNGTNLMDSSWLNCQINQVKVKYNKTIDNTTSLLYHGLTALPVIPAFQSLLISENAYRNYANQIPVGQRSAPDQHDFDLQMTHSAGVLSCAFSPDGAWLLSGSEDMMLKLWNRDTGACVQTYSGHQDSVLSCAFSPDGAWLLSGSLDHTLKLWERDTGACVQTFIGHQDMVRSCAFSPDSAWLLSASADRTLKLWNRDTGACVQTFSGHQGWVNSSAFSPDGAWLLSASADRTLKLWERDTGACVQTFSGHQSGVFSCTFSPDGAWLLSGSDDNTLKLWNRDTGACVRTYSGHQGLVFSCEFSPDGAWLLSGSSDHTLKLWNRDTGACVQTFSGHEGSVRSCAFSPDGMCLLSGSSDKTLKLWERDTGACVQTYSGHQDSVLSCAFNPDGAWLLSGSSDKTLKLWERDTGACVQTYNGHQGLVLSCAFSPDGAWLLSGSLDHTLKLWERDTGACVQTFSGHQSGVFSCTFSPDGAWLLSASDDNTLKLWQRDTDTCIQTFSGHQGKVLSCAFSPDGVWLLSASGDNTLKLWNRDTGACVQTFNGHGGGVLSCAFSPDSAWLLSASVDRTLKLWNRDTGACVQTFSGHQGWVNSSAFSPDGACLLSASDDNTLKLWQRDTGTCIQTFSGHQGKVLSCAFSPDGACLLSGSADNTLRLWSLQGEEIMTVYSFGTQWLSNNHHDHLLRFTERAWRYVNWSNGVKTLPIETGAHEIIPSRLNG